MKRTIGYVGVLFIGLLLVAGPVFAQEPPPAGTTYTPPPAGDTNYQPPPTTNYQPPAGSTGSCVPTAVNNYCAGTSGTGSTGSCVPTAVNNYCAGTSGTGSIGTQPPPMGNLPPCPEGKMPTDTYFCLPSGMQNQPNMTNVRDCGANEEPQMINNQPSCKKSMMNTQQMQCAQDEYPMWDSAQNKQVCKKNTDTQNQPNMTNVRDCGANEEPQMINNQPSCKKGMMNNTQSMQCGEGEYPMWDSAQSKQVCKKMMDASKQTMPQSRDAQGKDQVQSRWGEPKQWDQQWNGQDPNLRSEDTRWDGRGQEQRGPMEIRECGPDEWPSMDNPCRMMKARGMWNDQGPREQDVKDWKPCPMDGPPSRGSCRPPSDKEIDEMQKKRMEGEEKRRKVFEKQMDNQRFEEMKSERNLNRFKQGIEEMEARLTPLKALCNVWGTFYPPELDDMIDSAKRAFEAVQAAKNITDLEKAMNSFMQLKTNNAKWTGGKITELYGFCENYGRANKTLALMIGGVEDQMELTETLAEERDYSGAQEAHEVAQTLFKKVKKLKALLESDGKILKTYGEKGAKASTNVVNTNFFGQLKSKIYRDYIPDYDPFEYRGFEGGDEYMFEQDSRAVDKFVRLQKQKRQLASN